MTYLSDDALGALEERVGGSFRERALLERALTHSSGATAPPGAPERDNQRLAFLGQAIMLMAVALHLCRSHPEWDGSLLDRARAAIICRETLGEVGRRLGLNELLLVGPGEEQSGVRERDSLLARAVEALVGAFMLEAADPKIAEYAAKPIVNTIVQSLLTTIATVHPDVQDEGFLRRLGEELAIATSSPLAAEAAAMDGDSLRQLEARIGHRFGNRSLLEEALTHPSCRPGAGSNARLAFAGDAIVGAVIGSFLYRARPYWTVTQMSKVKASAVGNAPLARIARALGLGEALLLGAGEERNGGRDSPAVLASALEALVAAVYLDREPDAERISVREFVLRLFGPILEAAERRPDADHKSLLQERAQETHGMLPRYRVIEESGPDHNKTFVVQAYLGKNRVGEGSGRSKKEAEQEAARMALGNLRK